MKNKAIFPIIIIISLTLSACNLPATSPLAQNITPTDPPAATQILPTALPPTSDPLLETPLPTVSATALPTTSPTPVILPTEEGVRACVPQTDITPPDFTDLLFEDYPGLIRDYLNAGGEVAPLVETIYAANLADRQSLYPPVVEADLTGDGRADFAISLDDLERTFKPSPGALLIFTCWEDQVIFTHFEPSPDGLSTPAIVHIQDINADGDNELIVSSLQVGAHSLFEFMQILSWNGEQFLNHLYAVTGDMPFPKIQLTDFDRDGIYDLEVTSSGYGSVGAGPQRTLTRTWIYDVEQDAWLYSHEVAGFSTYRLHTLHDADAAMQRGEYEIGLLLYQLVFTDASLIDWIHPGEEQYALGAYARLKTVVGNALLDQHEQALDMLLYMGSSYLEGTPQRVYYEMADLFYNAYLLQGQQVACQAIISYARVQAETVLYPLGANTTVFPDAPTPFGYANSIYAPETICP